MSTLLGKTCVAPPIPTNNKEKRSRVGVIVKVIEGPNPRVLVKFQDYSETCFVSDLKI